MTANDRQQTEIYVLTEIEFHLCFSISTDLQAKILSQMDYASLKHSALKFEIDNQTVLGGSVFLSSFFICSFFIRSFFIIQSLYIHFLYISFLYIRFLCGSFFIQLL